MSSSTRGEVRARASLGGVVSKLATDLAANRGELEAARALLARRESELAAAEARHEAALRAAQVLTRENEALADAWERAEGTLAILHEALREQSRLRARQHRALLAADEDRAWLLGLIDRILTQLATLERRASPLTALLRNLWATPEPPAIELLDLPARGRSVLLLALDLTVDEVRGVVAMALTDAAGGLVTVLATDTEIEACPIPLVLLPSADRLRHLPGRITAAAYRRERVVCLCRRLVPKRVMAFGPTATHLLAELRAAGEPLELTAPETGPSGHTPTSDAPS